MPKVKYTARQQWTSRALAYGAWKRHVIASIVDGLKSHPDYMTLLRQIATAGKPFSTSRSIKGRMRIFIRWANDAHGDPEGIFGSIADALFVQDKYLVGSFDFDPVPCGQGSVDVEISLEKVT